MLNFLIREPWNQHLKYLSRGVRYHLGFFIKDENSNQRSYTLLKWSLKSSLCSFSVVSWLQNWPRTRENCALESAIRPSAPTSASTYATTAALPPSKNLMKFYVSRLTDFWYRGSHSSFKPIITKWVKGKNIYKMLAEWKESLFLTVAYNHRTRPSGCGGNCY